MDWCLSLIPKSEVKNEEVVAEYRLVKHEPGSAVDPRESRMRGQIWSTAVELQEMIIRRANLRRDREDSYRRYNQPRYVTETSSLELYIFRIRKTILHGITDNF